MKYNLKNIPENSKFLFFWGHQPSKDGSITKSCFSQWWKSDFSEDGILFSSAEQYMMAGKAKLFKDDACLQLIQNTRDPKECKKLGRKIKNFDDSIWNENKYSIVKQANLLKFSQDKDLQDYLKSTEAKVIVEASPYDRIWGIGMNQNDPRAMDPKQWQGENLLGFALMEVRDVLSN